MARGRHIRRLVAVAAVGAACLPAAAGASQLIDRNARDVRLAVNGKGEALVTYRAGGRLRRVLAWGAVNARFPNGALPQMRFRKDYSGGWGKYRQLYWRTFRNGCRGHARAWPPGPLW